MARYRLMAALGLNALYSNADADHGARFPSAAPQTRPSRLIEKTDAKTSKLVYFSAEMT
jgi:hypothetical protein